MHQIKVKNCNNIQEGSIQLIPNKLNIKYGINGTGKSTLARAIQFVNDDEKLKSLQSYCSKNPLVQLVYTEYKDISFVTEMEWAHENAKYVGQWSYKQHEDSLTDTDILHLIIKKSNGQNIGYTILKGIRNQNNSIELMRIVITNKNCGYGKTIISLIKKWCFEVRKAHRLWLDVRENNLRAQHMYETQGFISEGILRECIKVGNTYHSLIVMPILNQNHTTT